MPTPSAEAPIRESHAIASSRTTTRPTCPPDESHQEADAVRETEVSVSAEIAAEIASASPTDSPLSPTGDHELATSPTVNPSTKHMGKEDDGPFRYSPSPMSSTDEASDCDNLLTPSRSSASTDRAVESYSSLLESPFPAIRFRPNSSSSFLQPGSKFHGEQKSDNARYGVQVEIQHVDMAESFLCGYLSIQGLTNAEQTLTTYFEGEIIGTKYTFVTKHADWGSNEKVDMAHWARFPAWRPLSKQAKRPDFSYKNFAQRENVFMRWKEYFLVPDHTRKTINGASYEGFYYICFNQVSGTISGMYYHARTAKYQKLDLTHVNDHGCLGATEFR